MKQANTYHIKNRNYRNSFQGQEHHDEIRGKGNYINYKYRGHDPRIGRLDWLIDPLAKDYPYYTPYQFSGNKLIHAIELEGLEEFGIIDEVGKKFKPLIHIEDTYFGQNKRILNPEKFAAYQKENQLDLSDIESNPKEHYWDLKNMSINYDDYFEWKTISSNIEETKEKYNNLLNEIDNLKNQKTTLEKQRDNIYDVESFQKETIFNGVLDMDGYGPSHGAKSGYGIYTQRRYGDLLGSIGVSLKEINKELKGKYSQLIKLQKDLKDQNVKLQRVESKIKVLIE